MTIKLYWHPLSIMRWRVRSALHEKGLAYDERYPEPPLMPTDPAARAKVRQWMGWSTDYWPIAWKKWIAPRLPNARWTDASVAEGRREIAMHLDVLDSVLAHGEWIVERYSLADICYAPLVLLLERVELGDEVAGRPGVARWCDRLRTRPAIRDTMMVQPARF